jgi:hypothetical protein
MWKILRWFGLAGLISLGAWAYQGEGVQQAMFPARLGLSEISPDVWTDDAEMRVALLAELALVDARMEQFFGARVRPGRLIFCTQPDCATRLGLVGGTHAFADWVLTVGPGSISATEIGRGMARVALNADAGLRDLAAARFPVWFQNGLGAYLFPRGDERPSPEPDWIRAAQSRRDWRRIATDKNAPDMLGSAAQVVAARVDVMGEAGLRDLIQKVVEGARFDATFDAGDPSALR